MSCPSCEVLYFVPDPIFPSSAPPSYYGCRCFPMGDLERLPLLHAILDRTARSFVGRVLRLVFQIAISLSVILLPTAILQILVTTLECIDRIGFLLVCCVEVYLPSLNGLCWGDIQYIPPACRDKFSSPLKLQGSFSSGMFLSL